MIIIKEIAHLLWGLIKTDRVVQAGTGTSATSIWGSAHLAGTTDVMSWVTQATPWITLFAAVFGGMTSAATFIYVCIKIRRLLADPKSLE